jgi:hypothetical protein
VERSSSEFDKPIRGWDGKKRVTKPSFRGAADSDEPLVEPAANPKAMPRTSSDAFDKPIRGWDTTKKRVTKPSFRGAPIEEATPSFKEAKPPVAPTQIKIPRGAVPGTVLEYPSDGGERLRVSSFVFLRFWCAPKSLGRPLRWWCRTGSSPATSSRSGRGAA